MANVSFYFNNGFISKADFVAALEAARKAAKAIAKKEAGKRHYDAIVSKVVRTAKVVKVRADRSITKMERELHAELVISQFITDLAKVDKAKARRVWESARAVFLRVTAIISKSARKAARKAVASIEAANELITRIDAAKAEDARSSIGAADMSAVNKLSLELAMEAIQSMFNSNNNRTGIRGIDWVDDSRLIDEDYASECAERQKEDNMFKFDLQLFAEENTHRASKHYVRSMKGHEGNAMAYNIKAVPTDKHGNYKFVINREYAEITPLTRSCLHSGQMEMADLTGRKIVVKRAFDKYATLDTSAMICSTRKQVRRAGATIPMLDILIGEYKGKIVACSHMRGDNFMVVMSGDRDKNGNRYMIDYSEAVDVMTGKTKDGWMNFADYKIFGASKGRKNLFDMFEQGSDFEAKLDIATCGEYSKVYGTVLDQKETADAVTRLGSKSCRLGSEDIIIDNVLILLDKDSHSDGSGFVANLPGVREGYLIQCRPYTAKGAAQSVSSLEMEVAEENHRVVEWDKHNLTERQEYLLNVVLNKHDMAESGMTLKDIKKEIDANAIRLVGDPAKKTQLLGDLNFFKDKWDYSRNSGLNIIDIACFTGDDFKDAYTSGQMLKVVLRAMRDSNDVQLKNDFDVFMRQIIASEVKEKMSLDYDRRFRGTEKFNLGYALGAYMQLNVNSWKQDPEVFNAVIKEKIKAIKDTMNRDRYGIYGHSTMVTVESTHFFTNGRHSLLGTDIENGVVKSFEVYDPVWCRYAEKNSGVSDDGFVIKYPSMGTKEGILVKFVTEKEMLERINNICVSDKTKAALRKSIVNFKEGATMVPNSLPVLALVLAGFDLDGDHFEIIFATKSGLDIPTLLKRANFIGTAVNIGKDKAGYMAKMEFTPASWASYARMIVNSENKSVGTVTNVFRLFTDGLLRDLSEPDVHEFYKNLFMAVGCANGKKDYKTVGIKYGADKDYGDVFTYQVAVDAMEMFIENIKNVNLDNVNNIYSMLDDLDKLGRACQELTIDAQKKFYNVFCDWMDKVTNFSLFALSYGLEFNITGKRDKDGNVKFNVTPVENDGYCIKDGFFVVKNVLVKKVNEFGTKYVLADSFVNYRTYCANYACKMIEYLLCHYNEACVNYKAMLSAAKDTRLTMLNSILNEKGMHQIERIARGVYTINKMRAEATDGTKKLFSTIGLSVKMKEKLSRDISAGVNSDYGVMLDAISNEIRRICASNDMDPMMVAEALTLRGNLGGISGKVLQYERFINMINKSDTPVFSDILRAPNALKKWFIDNKISEVQVFGGVFYNIGCPEFSGTDVECDLVDGKYSLSVDANGELIVSRPMTAFVDANVVVDEDSRVIVDMIKVKDESEIKAIDNALVVNNEYTIKVNTGKRVYSLNNENGDVVTKLHFGDRKTKVCGSEEPNVNSKGYGDFSGKLISKIVCPTDYVSEDGYKYYNVIIALKK